jgi:hypothetical protein
MCRRVHVRFEEEKQRNSSTTLCLLLYIIMFPAVTPLFLVWGGSRDVYSYSEQSYEHRWALVQERLLFLSGVFAVDVCAYAVMSNHAHVVLHVDKTLPYPSQMKRC